MMMVMILALVVSMIGMEVLYVTLRALKDRTYLTVITQYTCLI